MKEVVIPVLCKWCWLHSRPLEMLEKHYLCYSKSYSL